IREFEDVDFTYNIVLSAACFGQLKRHRMSTITSQPYNPELGVTIPESIKEIGFTKKFMDVVEQTNIFYDKLFREKPLIAPYILTNAHRRRVLFKVNAREVYHISRLRQDSHAQWDIRNISTLMSKKAKEVMPFTFALLGGKDKYMDIYQAFYGDVPKVTLAVLPGVRKIK
ncbi:MAG: FAD-dependent thymidylate synthase, partial [Candidatus Omnitrophica bacterium]|nr:FAD-dependent thymidylate synthase [Candidatus Omnitrophota bacterium]